jgi:hypothetical protein
MILFREVLPFNKKAAESTSSFNKIGEPRARTDRLGAANIASYYMYSDTPLLWVRFLVIFE